MLDIRQNNEFMKDYALLKAVTLNPARHLALNAYDHCEMVARQAQRLAYHNGCSDEHTALLINLARVHDIGKVNGTANPSESIKLMSHYGGFSELFLNLVKYHDINLPWYIAHNKGQTPSDKAWRKMLNKVDIKLLCLFMVADRVDCPGGWKHNEALMWFLNEVEHRQLMVDELILLE